MKRFLLILSLCMFFLVPAAAQDDLCTDGALLFREDFGGNDPSNPRVSLTPVPGMTYQQRNGDGYGTSTGSMGSGRYIVTKSGYCNGDTTGWSLPGTDQGTHRSQWYIQDDHTYPDDYSRGYFMEIDGYGGDNRFYETEISGLCAGTRLTFLAYVANVFTWFQYDWYTRNRGPVVQPCLKFVLTDPETGEQLASQETNAIPFDESLPAITDWQYSSRWHLVGMNFTVPDNVESVRLAIYNNVTNGNGNDFALDDIEVRLCIPPIRITTDDVICRERPVQLRAELAYPYMVYEKLFYKWWFSPDNDQWTEIADATTDVLSFSESKPPQQGWYRVAMATEGNLDQTNCRTLSEPFLLRFSEKCIEPVHQSFDTVVCDTLLPLTWRGYTWQEPGTHDITLRDIDGDDSVYLHLTLDTVRCERLWPIIVNKYNWQLLVNNIAVRTFFPERVVMNYQWYKDQQPIPGANEDDYAEQNELHGVFQMRLTLDGGETVWSNILYILTTPEEEPTQVQIFNASGMPVNENRAAHGIFFYRFIQGTRVWTQKRLLP